jgi:hypothetical protein
VNGFSRYKKGRHTFQGGGYLGDLKHKQARRGPLGCPASPTPQPWSGTRWRH